MQNLNLEWFIAHRLASRNLGARTVSKPIVKIAIGAVALGIVIMLVAASSGMGFKRKVREKILGYSGQVHITSFENTHALETAPISIYQDFYTGKQKLPGVKHIQVYAERAGIIRTATDFEGLVFKGVSRDYDWRFFRDYLVAGQIPHYAEKGFQDSVLISQTVARDLQLKPGDRFNMFFLQPGKPPKARGFVIGGIFDTGIPDFDRNVMLGDLNHLRRLNGWDDTQVGGFELLLNDFSKLEQTSEKIYAVIDQKLNAIPITVTHRDIFDWLELFDLNIAIILVIMLLVAVLNMVITLIIMIMERTQTIGLLKALGATDWRIRKIFVYQALQLLFKGLWLGNAVGLGLLFLQKRFGLITLDPKSYYVTVAPVSIDWIWILSIDIGTIAVCFAVLLLPSYMICKIPPVRAIRFD